MRTLFITIKSLSDSPRDTIIADLVCNDVMAHANEEAGFLEVSRVEAAGDGLISSVLALADDEFEIRDYGYVSIDTFIFDDEMAAEFLGQTLEHLGVFGGPALPISDLVSTVQRPTGPELLHVPSAISVPIGDNPELALKLLLSQLSQSRADAALAEDAMI